MRGKSQIKLWIYVTASTSLLFILSSILFAVIFVVMDRLGVIRVNEENPHNFFVFLSLVSLVIGTTMSSFVAKKILKPITTVSKASSEIAKGNFEVRLPEGRKIKEIQELSRNFNIMAQELSSIETLRNDFVVNVSHEFKTPIAAIEGYATLLQDSSLSESERDDYVQMIIDSSRQLATLSGNILALSRLEAQEIMLERKVHRIDEQIRQAILLLESQWSAKRLDLHIDMPSTTYCGNERLLMQVWMNIINNAIKFTPEEGKIYIRLSSDEKAAIVSVSDSGCGIEEAKLKRIFDKFYQGDSARKSEGNGLGLTLSKRIAELCGGEIRVRSEVGKGSIFTVVLPHY
jgi:Signal transduction histidine kinase